MFIFVPLNRNAVVALMLATASVPDDPLSVNVKSVLGVTSESRMVKTPFVPAVAILIDGVLLERLIGNDAENVAVPDAKIFVTPVSDPVFVTPPLLLLIEPLTESPPDEIVCKAVNVFA